MWCEAFLCPVLSMSISRLALMEHRGLRPDPTDWQIIRCSNCLQCLASVAYCVSCIVSITVGGEAGEIARIVAYSIDAVACCFTSSVGGCMYIQVREEVNSDGKAGARPPVVVAEAVEGPGKAQMER
ncbi:hypothetical protein TeGR_g4642 [Tetraparma gracilis]|jgi:hypothetical protein|uniref:Uncharacterized protein n=1 Tax=Tetraparma gracilis TaxID=2962635 RepID=A0ABQ6MY46_9STRA|nr:hypothetical protein TeGR_g4642 [Tetraparma gracilis]